MIEIIIGIASGIFSGLGMGGGTTLILFQTLFLGYDQHIAQATNLIFFIPTSIIAIIIHWKSKNLNWRNSLPIAIFGIIGAIGGAIVSKNMQVAMLRKFFGGFLLCIATYEIYSFYKGYRKNKKKA